MLYEKSINIMDIKDDILCADCGNTVPEFHICIEQNNNEILNTTIENIEELINEVFIRPAVWDSTLPYIQRGPSIIKSNWLEIDKKLNLCPGVANAKWRNLRDTYVRKLNEQKKYIPSGSEVEAKPKVNSWPYFELMGFIRPTVTRRKTFSNVRPQSCDHNMNDDTDMKQSSTSKSSCSVNGNNTFIEKQRLTPSPNEISESSVQESYDYKQHNLTPVTSNHSQKRMYFNSNMNSETSKKAKNIHLNSPNNNNLSVKVNAGKKGGNSKNKENDTLSLLQHSILSEIKATDESLNVASSDPVIAFTNYLATQLRTLSNDDFRRCQRKILSVIFELQDN